MINNKLLIILVGGIVVIVAIILGIYFLNPFKNLNTSTTSLPQSTTVNLKDLKNKLTPQIRQCIVQKLGAAEVKKLLQEIRTTKTVSPDIKEKLASCFEDNFEQVKPRTSINPDKKVATSNKDIQLIKNGTIEGYNYWLYENTKYPCGKSGNHEFVVLQKGETKDKRNLFIRFHGGGFGFYKSDGTYTANPPNLVNQLYAEKERSGLFSSVLGDGLAKLIRETPGWRIMTPSYCSMDLYFGTGQYNQYDGFARLGFLAAQAAIDFTEKEFPTIKTVTGGSSAGSSGAFYNGYNRNEVVGMVMDSNSTDFSTSINYCTQNIATCCGNVSSCECSDQGRRCMEIGAERINFKLGQDEPRIMIQQGKINKPLYYIWNQHDQYLGGQFGSQNPSYFYQPTHNAVVKYNPGGKSIAKMVCVTNPARPENQCSIHSPTKYDNPETTVVYNWIVSLVK